MKKKMLAMFFAAMMVCGVAGCGGTTENADNKAAEEIVQDSTKLDAKAEAEAEVMKGELQAYAPVLTAEDAGAAGMYTIKDGAVVSGQEKWDAFLAGEADSVTLCQFTVKGGTMLDFVKQQEDGSYLVVSDLTRDGYEYEEKEDYKAQVFTEIKVFENFTVQEGGTPHTVCVLTNDAKLDADTFLQYWNDLSYEDNGAFMLFVI